MKNLLYKEFRLAMHPLCYLFIVLFPFMILIPNYPITIGFIYVLTCYPILFLGAKQGQQSNDLLYSVLLPVRKRDIVRARLYAVLILQLVFIAIASCLVPLAIFIRDNVVTPDIPGQIQLSSGIPLEGYVSALAIALVGYAVADLIFFPIYYKNGKSIVLSTLLMIIGYAVYICVFTIAVPYIPVVGEWYVGVLVFQGLGAQFIVLAIAIVIFVLLHILVYRISSKQLEKVDF